MADKVKGSGKLKAVYPFENQEKYTWEDFAREVVKQNPDPAGGTPKDGPSAGCAFAIGFISLILNKSFNHKVAMTGEIDLNSLAKSAAVFAATSPSLAKATAEFSYCCANSNILAPN